MSVSQRAKWTNKSVVEFAQGGDPISLMQERARGIVLEAMDNGWAGPPFDPMKLAQLMNISVLPNGDISDARIEGSDAGHYTIEFNPNRPRGRVKFSVAHEIAHTFFPDCAEEVRNRDLSRDFEEDDWQLEMLCNIGAAELIMPVGSFTEQLSDNLSISSLMELRKHYEVSTEALLIRLAKVTNRVLAIFCASRIEKGRNAGKYRVDYYTPSRKWPKINLTGLILSKDTILGECTAIGYSAMADETWSAVGEPARIECVGLPAYPGASFPRVAGFIHLSPEDLPAFPHVRMHTGRAELPGGTGKKIIAHIVNDKATSWGGGGFAQALKSEYPESHTAYKNWVRDFREERKLGGSFLFKVHDELWIFNMVAQSGYGPSEFPRIRYAALAKCLHRLAEESDRLDASVHMPLIGTGNAGGKWPLIQELIEEQLVSQNVPTNVYQLP